MVKNRLKALSLRGQINLRAHLAPPVNKQRLSLATPSMIQLKFLYSIMSNITFAYHEPRSTQASNGSANLEQQERRNKDA